MWKFIKFPNYHNFAILLNNMENDSHHIKPNNKNWVFFIDRNDQTYATIAKKRGDNQSNQWIMVLVQIIKYKKYGTIKDKVLINVINYFDRYEIDNADQHCKIDWKISCKKLKLKYGKFHPKCCMSIVFEYWYQT